MIDWNDETHCNDCKKYREFSTGEYGCGAAYGVCKFEEKTNKCARRNEPRTNDEVIEILLKVDKVMRDYCRKHYTDKVEIMVRCDGYPIIKITTYE